MFENRSIGLVNMSSACGVLALIKVLHVLQVSFLVFSSAFLLSFFPLLVTHSFLVSTTAFFLPFRLAVTHVLQLSANGFSR